MPTLMPVYSPLPFGAVLSGLAATLSPARAARASVEIGSWLQRGDPERELLLLDSGTTALTLALRATAGEQRGAVAIPAFACYDIATAVDGAEVPFVFYDLDPLTLGPDLASLRRALQAGADRIVLVHLYGVPVDLDAATALAREFGALIIEDAAQGSGGEWNGRALGTSGSLGILSFGRGKGITGGTGGALLGNDAAGRAALATARGLTAPGKVSPREVVALVAQWLLARRWLYWLPASLPFLGLGETTYRAPRPGARISPFAAGVLRRTAPMALGEEGTRRLNAAALAILVAPTLGQPMRAPARGVAGFLRLPVLLPRAAPREAPHAAPRSQRSDRARLGIMHSYPLPLSELPGFASRQSAPAEFTGARALSERLITVPVHSQLTQADVRRLGTWLGE